MKKSLFAFFGACMLAAGAHATIHNIQVADFSFSPAASVTVPMGDTVMWMWVSGSHTTTSATIPSGAASWDSPITSSAQMFMYVPTKTGAYNYVCTPHASMGMTGSFTVVSTTGISSIAAVKLMKVNPNPATSNLHIELLHGKANLAIVDATGKAVYAQQFSGNLEIPVITFANGVYFVRVEQDGQQSIERIVIAH